MANEASMPIGDVRDRERPIHSRSRQGCLTCRRHRLKCDETVPVCLNCSRLRRDCRWGVKLSYHRSRMFYLTTDESRNLAKIEAERNPPGTVEFVDNTQEIVYEYVGSEKSDGEKGPAEHGIYRSVANSEIDLDSLSSTLPVAHMSYASDSILKGSSSRDLVANEPFNNATSAPTPLVSAASYDHSSMGKRVSIFNRLTSIRTPSYLSTSSTSASMVQHTWPIDSLLKAKLMASYFQETSAWCETADSQRHFSVEYGHLITKSEHFCAAAVALASRHLEIVHGQTNFPAQGLYDFACKIVASVDHLPDDETVLAAKLLLSTNCVMSKDIHDWQALLQDVANTLKDRDWANYSSTLSIACFWAFVRLDIWAAYLTQKPIILPPILFVSLLKIELRDRYCNKVVWIFARIIDELSEIGNTPRVSTHLEQNSKSSKLQGLWTELQDWLVERPDFMRPLIEIEGSEREIFVTILFSSSSAVCANIFYHTGCILLLATGDLHPSALELSAIGAPSCHAGRIGGISITNKDHSNWINNIQPILIAARYYTKVVEKFAILRHLKDIETQTGWKTSSESQELRRLWGLE